MLYFLIYDILLSIWVHAGDYHCILRDSVISYRTDGRFQEHIRLSEHIDKVSYMTEKMTGAGQKMQRYSPWKCIFFFINN